MSPQLQKVAERAQREPDGKFHSLAHLIDVPALHRAYHRLRPDAAVGVDKVTMAEYGQDLMRKLTDLHERLKAMRWRHQPIRRVHIPKAPGKTRPIGIAAVEDKIVQSAIREVLEAVHEQDFLDCSYGFRPGRRAHDAIRTLSQTVHRGEVNWIVEADIQSYFDSIDRKQLIEILHERVPDGSLLRLISKCLHAGVLDGETFVTPDTGTAQGSVLSPLLGNVYLHHVLDRWFEREVKPRLKGKATLVRYADDFVILCERRDDAERVLAVLPKRLQRYGLTLHSDKTRLLDWRRPPHRQQTGSGPATFDFLGFTLHWRRSRGGRWIMACKTRRERLRRAIQSVRDWCRIHRHLDLAGQHRTLCQKLQGHINYFGVNGNSRSLGLLIEYAQRAWHCWLNRRSQRSRLNWQRFKALLGTYPLPRPRIAVSIWGVP
jgi:RNA-directed DNA polymerase